MGSQASGVTGSVDVKVAGRAIRLLRGDRVSDKIVQFGEFEPDSLAAWAKMVEPMTMAIDVGAYSGIYAIVVGLRGADVIAVEPAEWMHTVLRVNCAVNGVEVNLVTAAASDQAGIATLHYSGTAMTSGASLQRIGNNRWHRQVTTVTLDELPVKGRLSAIKIDVEHHEVAVLHGARQLIAKHHPKLLVEILGNGEERQANIAKVLAMLPGYRVMALLDGRNVHMEFDHGKAQA
jgi:FkbM family methyltransferase